MTSIRQTLKPKNIAHAIGTATMLAIIAVRRIGKNSIRTEKSDGTDFGYVSAATRTGREQLYCLVNALVGQVKMGPKPHVR